MLILEVSSIHHNMSQLTMFIKEACGEDYTRYIKKITHDRKG